MSDRGMKKWAPYKSLIEQTDSSRELDSRSDKVDKPTLIPDEEERINYIKLAAKENLSARTLEKFIAQDVIHHRGVLPNNFQKTIPDSITAQRAIMAFKDEYLLDFINVEQLGARDLEDVDESVIENSIVHNM